MKCSLNGDMSNKKGKRDDRRMSTNKYIKMMDIEYYHFITTTVRTDSGHSYEWILKPLDERLVENRIY